MNKLRKNKERKKELATTSIMQKITYGKKNRRQVLIQKRGKNKEKIFTYKKMK